MAKESKRSKLYISENSARKQNQPVPQQVKKNAFRYSAQIGHFPKEIESFVFIKRVDPLTKVSKVAPELVYPIQANRSAVPKHALLEEDWRAFRSVLFNYQTLVRTRANPQQRYLEYLKCNDLVGRIYRKLAKHPSALHEPDFTPSLALYKNSMDAPLGYVYRQYKMGNIATKSDRSLKTNKQELKIPVLVFEGPFMDIVHISQGERVKAKWDKEMDIYDADAVVTGLDKRNMIVYNEPDAIPNSCARIDYSLTLSQRAIKMATSLGPDVNANIVASQNANLNVPNIKRHVSQLITTGDINYTVGN